MELKVTIDLEAAVAQALAPEKLQPILDKQIIGAITSAIDDATGYRSTFRTALKEQLAGAMPHGIEIADVAKFQHVLNEVLRNAVGGFEATLLSLYVGRTKIEFDMDSDDVQSAASEQYDD